MKTRILIKQGRCIDLHNKLDEVMDVYIEDDHIVEVAQNIDFSGGEITLIDAKNMIVAPGLVDMHCHLREPGFEYKEDIETGSAAAVLGGFTSIACMPNTSPVVDNKMLVNYIMSRGEQVGLAHVYPIGSITKGQEGKELSNIGEMKFAGAVAISDDGLYVESASVMLKALQYANMFDTLIISHSEDTTLSKGGSMNLGYMSTKLGVAGIPACAEEVAIARDCILAESAQAPIHIAHVSTRRSVEIIRAAKRRGVRVTCETCPHYFTLTELVVDDYNTNAKMSPPLRTKDDVEAIIEGLTDGTIDAIATDHAPHSFDEKNREFDKAPNGIVGLETAFPLAYTYLVRHGYLTLPEAILKMSYNPSRILGLGKGTLSAKKTADVMIFDPAQKYIVKVENFASKSKNSPYDGYELYGKPLYTIVGGKVVVREGVV